jgi:hypothetical protein
MFLLCSLFEEEKDKELMPENAPEEPKKATQMLLDRIAEVRAHQEALAALDDANEETRLKLAEKKEVYKRLNYPISLSEEPTEPLADEAIAQHMTFAAARADAPDPSAQTETLLNGMIAELHMLMRSVALPTATRTVDFGSRRAFLGTAMELAKTGGKLGRVVAKIRKSGTVPEYRERRPHEVSRENG